MCSMYMYTTVCSTPNPTLASINQLNSILARNWDANAAEKMLREVFQFIYYGFLFFVSFHTFFVRKKKKKSISFENSFMV